MSGWRLALAGTLFAAACVAAGPRWDLRFFYDKVDSEFHINDLQFPSARRGIACGFLDDLGDIKPRVLVTSDGGDTWTFVNTRRVGLSLFFLNDSLGWMVTDGAIWRTEESGRSWQRLSKLKNTERVYFVDENRGWAVGPNKSIYQTADGGRTWTRPAVADEPKTTKEYTAYGWIDFRNPLLGAIVGWSRPPRRTFQEFPDWMEPEYASRRRQWPSTSILIQTNDGGKSWVTKTTSMFGRITRIRFNREGKGLALVVFDDSFQYPSEVHRIDVRTGAIETTYHQANRAVTDVLLVGDRGYLAAFEPPGKMWQVPVPGALVMLRSDDLVHWVEMPVDYRAVADRAILAAAGPDDVWVATDTGMILKLHEQ